MTWIQNYYQKLINFKNELVKMSNIIEKIEKK